MDISHCYHCYYLKVVKKRKWQKITGQRRPTITPMCDCWTSHPKPMGINLLICRLSTTFWNLAAGICTHSATRAFMRLDTGCGDDVWLAVRVPGHPKGVAWARDQGLCAGQSSCSTSNSETISLRTLLWVFPLTGNSLGKHKTVWIIIAVRSIKILLDYN